MPFGVSDFIMQSSRAVRRAHARISSLSIDPRLSAASSAPSAAAGGLKKNFVGQEKNTAERPPRGAWRGLETRIERIDW